MTPEQRRTVVTCVRETAGLSERCACRYLGVHRALCRYRSRRPPDTELRDRLKDLAVEHPRWGCPRLAWLLGREGRRDNYKRIRAAVLCRRTGRPSPSTQASRDASPHPARRSNGGERTMEHGFCPRHVHERAGLSRPHHCRRLHARVSGDRGRHVAASGPGRRGAGSPGRELRHAGDDCCG